MSAAEYEATAATVNAAGAVTLRGGRPGDVFLTPDLYFEALEAQDKLSLPVSPELGVAYLLISPEIENIKSVDPATKGSILPGLPDHDTPGGGTEVVVAGPAIAIPLYSWEVD